MDFKEISYLNKTIRKLRDPAEMIFLPLDLSCLYVVGYADAAFANNADLSPQLGFIALLKDKNDNAAIIHYGSWKCQRVTRRFFGAENTRFSVTA